MIQSPLALATLIASITALSFWLDRRVPALSRVGAGMLAVLFGTILSNAGIVPAQSLIYDVVGGGPVTLLAITWLLLAVNLGDVKKAGGRMLGAFALACAGTCAGAILGGFVFAASFGDQMAGLAGTLTGTYTGGSVNFLSVGRATGIPDELFAGATAADNLTTGLWLGVTLLLPLWLGRFYSPVPIPVPGPGATSRAMPAASRRVDAPGDAAGAQVDHPYFTQTPMSALDIAIHIAAGLLLLMLASLAARLVPAVHMILWLTTFALIAGHLTPLGRVPGAFHLGNIALLFFFVIIGIHSRIADIIAVGIDVFWLTLAVVGVHGVIVFGIGRLLRLDIASIAVASQAAVGGPSSALAVAVARGWQHLIVPGVVVGLLGYATGTYLGFGVYRLLLALGVGG